MNTLSAFRAAAWLGLASLALAGALSQAQTTGRIKPVPQPAAPTPPAEPAVAPQPNVMGGRGQGSATPATTGMVAGPYTALQVAQSFLGADFNRDGELTRAEALRLAITPYSFEDMDQNKDGVLARAEYEAAFTR